ncbi:bifunctional 4-hydroxy-2-oxoglutarate aldolase/2-dehydro-3-deoxy-phosphogluconate aldolase [Actinobaculum sp. 352]|nr:2-dehydro-3-deoxyphosphogluconate aldolase [Actinobaculum sp. 313]RTE48444.1 bifunctional 4-hydroxy-2-oxoglutarate aldolase/2-dehydro-3-deoxy-phosphogluconate aldolase [Actinobaculum sp. 352]
MAELLAANPVVPVVVIDDPRDALAAGQALVAGGIHCAEVTFRTEGAAAAIEAMRQVEGLTVGAGTVIHAVQAEAAIARGATFLVSPGFSAEVAQVARAQNIPFVPGGATPTEIIAILDAGMTTVKFFPAQAMGGLPVLKAFSAPFPQVRFLPTGGISAANMTEWLEQPFIPSVGGSWMITRSMVAQHKFDEITALSAQAIAIARGER